MTARKTLAEKTMTALKNVDPTNPTRAMAAMNAAGVEITSRVNLTDKMVSIQWDKERGIGILMADIGARNHAANALNLTDDVAPIVVPKIGKGYARAGMWMGIPTVVWVLEQ
jgi:hypothetical protein